MRHSVVGDSFVICEEFRTDSLSGQEGKGKPSQDSDEDVTTNSERSDSANLIMSPKMIDSPKTSEGSTDYNFWDKGMCFDKLWHCQQMSIRIILNLEILVHFLSHLGMSLIVVSSKQARLFA